MDSLYWEVDPQDWDHREGESDQAHVNRIIADVKRQVRPGSIVLSHDFHQPDTVAAYEKLLPWLVARFVLGIPGEPLPEPPVTEPTPTETPTAPDPGASATPAPDDTSDTGKDAAKDAARDPAAKNAGAGNGAAE
jgi:hypothetical protein